MDLVDDLLLGHLVGVDCRAVDAAFEGHAPRDFLLNREDVVLGDDVRPNIDAHLDHIFHDGFADAVSMMDEQHAFLMRRLDDLGMQRLDDLAPCIGGQEEVLLGAPVVLIEDHIGMDLPCRLVDVADLPVRHNFEHLGHGLGLFEIRAEGVFHAHQEVAALEQAAGAEQAYVLGSAVHAIGDGLGL